MRISESVAANGEWLINNGGINEIINEMAMSA
jgi:hypothetical protein